MADITEILNGLQKVDSNPNNNTFIDLMQDIAGNPNDATNPADDTNSIYGSIVTMYNEMVEARSSDEEITEALNKIENLNVTATASEYGTDINATLNGSTIKLTIPKGLDGANGASPKYEFNYDETTGELSYNITGYTMVNGTNIPVEEV